MSVEATYDYIGQTISNALQGIHGLLPDEVTKNFYKNETDVARVTYMLKQPAVHQVWIFTLTNFPSQRKNTLLCLFVVFFRYGLQKKRLTYFILDDRFVCPSHRNNLRPSLMFPRILKTIDVFQVFSIAPDFEGKSLQKAKEFREKGNKLFQKKSYLNAMEHYTRCIMQVSMNIRVDPSVPAAPHLQNFKLVAQAFLLK